MAVGIFRPLDPFVQAERFDVGQYYPYCITEATYEGKLMALPHISEPGQVGLVMNLNLFEKAGVKPLDWNSKWEDLVNAAQKITKDNVFGYANNTDYFNWVTRVRSWGGDYLNAEGTKCVLDDQKALAAFQMQHDLVYKYKASPSPSAVQGSLDKMFQGGSLAMWACWPINASSWSTSIKDFKVGSTMLPPGPVGRGSLLNQHMMSVSAVTKYPEAAWEWVKWTCGRKFSLDRALKGAGGPVGMNSVWHDPDLLKKFPSWEEWAKVMDSVGPNYTAANLRGKELEDTFNQGITGIMVNEVSVKAGLDRVRQETQTILDKPIAK
jgi:ABC-type glycerol-3-phosphate transport system substrate-binding protein